MALAMVQVPFSHEHALMYWRLRLLEVVMQKRNSLFLGSLALQDQEMLGYPLNSDVDNFLFALLSL